MPKLKNAKVGLVPKPLSPAGRKRKGSRRERQTIALLEANGYQCTKAGGSLGVWDVIGVHSYAVPVLVQVKSNRKPPGDECIRMAAAPGYDCEKLVHVWIDGQSVPDQYEVVPDGHLVPAAFPLAQRKVKE